LRVIPAIGVPLALAYALSTRGATNEQIGLIQAVFMGGIGIGNFACALLIGRRSERLALWALPLTVVPPGDLRRRLGLYPGRYRPGAD
jgi:hypothetical protein